MDSVSFNNSNNISSSRCNFLSLGKVLSEETRRKLLELGIDPSTVTSESHAQMLIRQAEAKKIQNHNQQASSKSSCSSEYQLISNAKALAKKMGIKNTDGKTLSELVATVTDKITLQTKIYGENSQQVKDLNAVKASLEELKEEFSRIDKNREFVYSNLDMVANINKYYLGLNN